MTAQTITPVETARTVGGPSVRRQRTLINYITYALLGLGAEW